jgi:hypothetical protein
MAVEEKEIFAIPAGEISLEQALADVDRNIEFFRTIQVRALKLTKEQDWLDNGGSPYLMDKGAEKIGDAWGISVSPRTEDKITLTCEWAEDKEGPYFTYIAQGKAYSRVLRRWIEDIGVCSQRDKFFGMARGELKMLEDVDRAMIRKKAVTNLHVRLIKRMVGLLSATWEDLIAAGLDVSKIKKIEYQSQDKKLSAVAMGQCEKIKMMAMALGAGQEKAAAEALRHISVFKDSQGKDKFVTDVRQLTSDKWVASIYGKMKEIIKRDQPEDFARIFPDEKPREAAKR